MSGSISNYSFGNTPSDDAKKLQWVKIKDGDKTLLICDRVILVNVTWNDLNSAGWIFGKEVTIDGAKYKLRSLTGGSNYRNTSDAYAGGTPTNNEWDRFITREEVITGLPAPVSSDLDSNLNSTDFSSTHNALWNWAGVYTWCQETYSSNTSDRALRGYYSARHWYYNYATYSYSIVGFRPVLEVLRADMLGSDALKTVALDLNGGSIGDATGTVNIVVKNGESFTAPSGVGLTRPSGNTDSYFWWLGSDGKSYVPGAMIPAGVASLTAQWTALTYSVTLHENGGTLSSGNVTSYNYGEGATLPTAGDMTREGYTFAGWYDNEALTGTPVMTISNTEMGNKEYWAQWEINQYTVTVKPENGEADITITQDYGTPITAPADPTREGYTFIGWDREIPTTMPAEDMTVTAQWEINRYTITFDTAGGSEIAPITQDYGTNITAPADPTREGYTFIGWDKAIPTTMPAENITVTAQWKDSEKPTGEIKINENSWKAFLNNITFGLFFKDTQTVTITAADNSGETVTVEYLLSDKELTKAELDGMTFTAYTAPFGIDPDNEYIIYVRLTDKAGNTDYICSDGIVLDGTSPVITGIENGKTYCEAQTVTIDEKYVDTVTVNGTAVTLDTTGSFTLAPADGEQKIVVTDKAGNTAEMTVTVNDGHTFGEWTSNGDGTHTRQCTADGCTEGVETGNCVDEDKNHICDICGNIISNHEDANQDHVCDLCGKVISNHEDADKDHVCNHCGKVISNHEDANKDHVCELCGKTISNHEDANKDHVCDYCGKVFSNHEDADKDHVCDYCGKVITNHIGGKETCRDKAVCEVCGKSYGKLDPKNHTDLKHFPAKAATEDADGNIEYWYCSGCNKYYSDKDGTKEIKKADTVTAKLKDDSKSPQTGDTSNLALWIALLFVSGGVLTGVTVFDKRKRHSVK